MKRQSKGTVVGRQRKAPSYTLSDRDALLAVKRSVGKGVVKSVVKILDLIAQYPDVTRERLAKEVGLSVRGVEKNLAQLKSEGKIVRVGGRKGGHWEVAKRIPAFS